MLKDEAIELIRDAFNAWEDECAVGDDWSREHKARDMAIEALEQQPCEDAVSRADVVDMLEMYPFTEYSEYEAAREVVKRLPSAQPEITHCADCIHWKHSDVRKSYCDVFDWVNTAEDFCSFAEREDTE